MTTQEEFQTEAIDRLRREVPDELEWLPWREIPAMHWQDASAVDERVPRGWMVLAADRGEPKPDAEMRQRASLFDRGNAAAFAHWLLSVWIEHDTATPALTPARETELRAIAQKAADLAQRLGRGGTDPGERYQQLLRQESHRPAATALPHKGLLALVAACGDPTVATEAESYLERWQDERPESCRAVRTALSAIRAS